MAETVIAAAIGDVVSRVISLLLGRFNRRSDHQQSTDEAKLGTICHMLIRIRSVVEEAKGRQILNHGTLQWLSELIRVEYEGRYLLETTAAARRCDKINDDDIEQQDPRPGGKVSATSLFNPSKRVRLVAGSTMRRLLSLQHHDLGDDEIDRVQERLRDVSAHLREFIMLMHSCQPIVSRPLPTNILRDGQMFGRHVEKESVINFLLHTTTTTSGGCCSSGEGVVGVLPIVGDKGVGKTTLVQHACDDARVRDHFAVIMLCRWTYTTTTSTNGSGTYHPVLQYSKLTIPFFSTQQTDQELTIPFFRNLVSSCRRTYPLKITCWADSVR